MPKWTHKKKGIEVLLLVNITVFLTLSASIFIKFANDSHKGL